MSYIWRCSHCRSTVVTEVMRSPCPHVDNEMFAWDRSMGLGSTGFYPPGSGNFLFFCATCGISIWGDDRVVLNRMQQICRSENHVVSVQARVNLFSETSLSRAIEQNYRPAVTPQNSGSSIAHVNRTIGVANGHTTLWHLGAIVVPSSVSITLDGREMPSSSPNGPLPFENRGVNWIVCGENDYVEFAIPPARGVVIRASFMTAPLHGTVHTTPARPAIGNGFVDDTEAIQEALDRAHQAGIQAGIDETNRRAQEAFQRAHAYTRHLIESKGHYTFAAGDMELNADYFIVTRNGLLLVQDTDYNLIVNTVNMTVSVAVLHELNAGDVIEIHAGNSRTQGALPGEVFSDPKNVDITIKADASAYGRSLEKMNAELERIANERRKEIEILDNPRKRKTNPKRLI